jgi:hypothetical protein
MKFQTLLGGVRLTLSRRNLLTLLAKLDEPMSARTLYKREDAGWVEVRAEENDAHYGDRTPGVVSARTEATIAKKA